MTLLNNDKKMRQKTSATPPGNWRYRCFASFRSAFCLPSVFWVRSVLSSEAGRIASLEDAFDSLFDSDSGILLDRATGSAPAGAAVCDRSSLESLALHMELSI